MLLAAALVFAAGCSGPGDVVHLYDPVPVPFVPDHTESVPATGTPPDGRYWATIAAVDESAGTITFTFVQATFDADGGMTIDDQPSREIVASSTTLKFLSVATKTRQNYAVFADEMIRLELGKKPNEKAPLDFVYVRYPLLVTVEGGVITEAYQIWLEGES